MGAANRAGRSVAGFGQMASSDAQVLRRNHPEARASAGVFVRTARRTLVVEFYFLRPRHRARERVLCCSLPALG